MEEIYDVPPYDDDRPFVSTASFQKEGKNLIATLDGEEIVIPGAYVSIGMDDREDGGRIRVHLHASFYADAVDVIAEETGS